MFQRRETIKSGGTLEASVGTVLGGRYRVQDTLGSGGMAVVYKAEDSILGRTVALKTLHRRYAEIPTFRRRFRQEARAMASLDHPNIVKVYDISHDGEIPFIVAECVTGQDISNLLSERRGRLDEQFARRIASQLLEALAYAHRRGIIHRDIKPSNILLTPGGTVKVADFGIARIVEEEDSGGEPGEIIGSARYMSPEQLRGKQATQQSDIYSVGILLYHLLAGKPPFSGDLDNLVKQQLNDVPKRLRQLNRKVSPSMDAVVMKALEKDPELRYPSATAMLDDLEDGFSAHSSGGSREIFKKPRRTRTRLVAASALALVVLGGASAVGATSMGYVDLGGSPDAENVARISAARSVNSGAPEAPAPSDASEEKQMVAVPEVRPYYDYSAEEILRNQGFDVRIVYEYQTGYANRGVAWGTDPAVGEMAPEGSVVTVFATPKDLFQPQIDT